MNYHLINSKPHIYLQEENCAPAGGGLVDDPPPPPNPPNPPLACPPLKDGC